MSEQLTHLVTLIAERESERQQIYTNMYTTNSSLLDNAMPVIRARLETLRQELAVLWGMRREEMQKCRHRAAPISPRGIANARRKGQKYKNG